MDTIESPTDIAIRMTGRHVSLAVNWDRVSFGSRWITSFPAFHLNKNQLATIPTMSTTLVHRDKKTKITFGFEDSIEVITQTYVDGKPRDPSTALDLLEE